MNPENQEHEVELKIGEETIETEPKELTEEETRLANLKFMKYQLETKHYNFCNRDLRRKYKGEYALYKTITKLLELETKNKKEESND